MIDVSVCEQPDFDLCPVDVGQEGAEVGVGAKDGFEGKGVVDLGVVFEGVDVVVPDETFDCEAVLCVVWMYSMVGLGGGWIKGWEW